MAPNRIAVYILVLVALGGPTGCRRTDHVSGTWPTAVTVPGLLSQQYLEQLYAVVAPPAGWTLEVRDEPNTRGHFVWVSPSGRTAYGVAHFNLPLPLGHEPVLWGFLREMRRSEGEAELLSREWDPNQRLLRFVAKGGLYTVRTNLRVRGFNGWAVYAGTLTAHPVAAEELALAEKARELTLVGRLTRNGPGE